MSRLTKEITAYGKTYIKCNMKSCQVWECTDCQHFKEMLAKLKHYEDLEKTGRLIELPCPLYSRIYKVDKHNGIIESVFNYIDIPRFGKTIFLTKEEAEKALAELKR